MKSATSQGSMPLISKNSTVSLEAHDNFRDPPTELAA